MSAYNTVKPSGQLWTHFGEIFILINHGAYYWITVKAKYKCCCFHLHLEDSPASCPRNIFSSLQTVFRAVAFIVYLFHTAILYIFFQFPEEREWQILAAFTSFCQLQTCYINGIRKKFKVLSEYGVYLQLESIIFRSYFLKAAVKIEFGST